MADKNVCDKSENIKDNNKLLLIIIIISPPWRCRDMWFYVCAHDFKIILLNETQGNVLLMVMIMVSPANTI